MVLFHLLLTFATSNLALATWPVSLWQFRHCMHAADAGAAVTLDGSGNMAINGGIRRLQRAVQHHLGCVLAFDVHSVVSLCSLRCGSAAHGSLDFGSAEASAPAPGIGLAYALLCMVVKTISPAAVHGVNNAEGVCSAVEHC
jgi:hypothetical protein